MSQLTLLGYVIAAVAIVLGLFLILRRNSTAEQQQPADTATTLPVDSDSSVPVVPRDQRGQLAANAVPQVAPAEADALDSASLINPAASRQPIEPDAPAQEAAQPAINEHAIAALLAKPEPQLDHGAELDQALAQLDAATDPSHTESAPTVATAPAEVDAASSATLNPLVETAHVAEWQGESALLDAHIEDQSRRDDESALAQAEHILALYVMPPANRTINGERVFQLLRQFGLRYGEMSLFHRFQDAEGTGPLMFSVLRYTSEGPSGFDLETLAHESVEGLAFFLALPGKHVVAGYDMMVSISGLLAREVGGLVYDEHMNELTPQLREHYRHFVLDYRSTQA